MAKRLTKSEKEQRTRARAELLDAEARYLSVLGWAPLMPIATGAPVFWRDPITKDERSQDVAVDTQKMRDVDESRAQRRI
jgi:hypothetical protein